MVPSLTVSLTERERQPPSAGVLQCPQPLGPVLFLEWAALTVLSWVLFAWCVCLRVCLLALFGTFLVHVFVLRFCQCVVGLWILWFCSFGTYSGDIVGLPKTGVRGWRRV